MLHDVTDVALEAAKLHVYRGEETMANVCFVLFVTSWVAFRLIAFPMHIMEATWVHLPRVIGISPLWLPLNGLLGTLYVLHWIWFFMILRLLLKIALGAKPSDSREKSD